MKQANDAIDGGTDSRRSSERSGLSDIRWSKYSSIGLALLGMTCVGPHAQAAPEGGQIVAGSANIVQSQVSRLDVVQQSERAAINWQSFGIGASEHVSFQQPSPQSATLNRVTGPDLSSIHGRLTANGNVFLVNPNGILFGKSAKIDVGGLVASTANISDQDFMAGHYSFKEPSKRGSMIVNEGEINVAEGGLVALVAPGVESSGTITARMGRVALASGDAFTLDLYGDELVSLAVDDSVLEGLTDSQGNSVAALVNQTGTIQAEGGEVLLTAAEAQAAVDTVINMSGVIETQSVGQENGEIVLYGGADGGVVVAGILDASGKDSGESGGTVEVLGDEVALRGGAHLDVSGDTGGGTVLMGGDYQGQGSRPRASHTVVEQGASVAADALTRGDGGEVVVWADGRTDFHGHISAKGGIESGDGGFVEVSGKEGLNFRGDVDASAPNGQAGTVLFDPTNLNIGVGEDVEPFTIVRMLQRGTSVVQSASNDISVNGRIDGRGGASGAGLSLTAGHDVIINNDILTNNGAISMNAGDSITMQPGTILFSDSSPISLTAGGSLSMEHLVTTGDVTLSSRAGSVLLGQDLGGFVDSSGQKLPLGRLSITADQGMVSLQGLQSTGDVEVAALRNIDVNGPVQSSGNVTLTSQGKNEDKTAINLKDNIYTLGGDITLAGDVLLNPTRAELVEDTAVAFLPDTTDPSTLTVGATSNCDLECLKALCPTCTVLTVQTDGTDAIVVAETLPERFRFSVNTFLPYSGDETAPQGSPPLVIGFRSEGPLGSPPDVDAELATFGDSVEGAKQAADQRETALRNLFALRQVTLDSGGGDITFEGRVDRESFSALINFNLLGIEDGVRKAEFITVVFPSFVHHGLAVNAGSGRVRFEGAVGNQELLNISQQSVSGAATTDLPVIGSFEVSIASDKELVFDDDVFLNGLIVNGVNLPETEIIPPEELPADAPLTVGGTLIIDPTGTTLGPDTDYSASTNNPRRLDFSGITGEIIPGDPPIIGVPPQAEPTRCAPGAGQAAPPKGDELVDIVEEAEPMTEPTSGAGGATGRLESAHMTGVFSTTCPEQGVFASAEGD